MGEITTGHNRYVCFVVILHVMTHVCLPNYRGDDRTEVEVDVVSPIAWLHAGARDSIQQL